VSEPVEFKVWSENLDEDDAGAVIANTPFGAVMMALAEIADDDDLTGVEDWLVRWPNGRAHRFRAVFDYSSGLAITPLRACRKCGCADDRACDPPCSWVEDDLCSACRPGPPPPFSAEEWAAKAQRERANG
jgi:hypothetical protein